MTKNRQATPKNQIIFLLPKKDHSKVTEVNTAITLVQKHTNILVTIPGTDSQETKIKIITVVISQTITQ